MLSLCAFFISLCAGTAEGAVEKSAGKEQSAEADGVRAEEGAQSRVF